MIINFVETITEEQAESIRDRLPAASRLIFALGLETGLRISDILQLRVKDIAKPLRVHISRPGVIGTFYLSRELYASLMTHTRNQNASRYIFPGRSYKKHIHMHRTTYHRHLKHATAGLDFSCSAHSTRKLFRLSVL